MTHKEFIETLTERGEKARYADALGISRSFLRQIETGRARTPRRIYDSVIKLTGGRVGLAALVAETAHRSAKH